MSVESSEDRLAFVQDFGDEVTWTRAGVPQPAFLAIFNRPSTFVQHDVGAETLNRAATLWCPLSSIPAGAVEDDPVAISETIEGDVESFACSAIRPDGTGWCVVDLKRT